MGPPSGLERFSLAGKRAVITGASRNIGAAVALGFAQADADLLLVARGSQRLEAHAADIRSQTGRQVETFAADVTKPSAATEIAAYADETLGPVDVLDCAWFWPPAAEEVTQPRDTAPPSRDRWSDPACPT
jgi:NAD(P)-dependent dehydrogenase (short-subunit alcohol dehydrogenase family)